MNSPIRYFGGKGGMYKEIIKHFPSDDTYDTYLEAFGGGGSILFQKSPNTPIEIYNDLEENVYSLFKSISDPLLFKIFKEKCDLTYYSEQLRKEYIQSLRRDSLSIVDRAYKYFIVNRTSRNGIGGFSMNLIIRRNMSKSISDMLSTVDNLEPVHQRLSRVIITNKDALKMVDEYNSENVFIYADPPYHHSRRTNVRYKVDMDNEKQKIFIDKIINSKSKILLSGYNNDEYERLLENNNWIRVDFDVHTVDGKERPKTKVESLWKNYQLTNKNLFE